MFRVRTCCAISKTSCTLLRIFASINYTMRCVFNMVQFATTFILSFFNVCVCVLSNICVMNCFHKFNSKSTQMCAFSPIDQFRNRFVDDIVVFIQQSGSLLLLCCCCCRLHPSQSGAHTPLAHRPRLPDTPSPQSLPTVFFKTTCSFDSSRLSSLRSLRSYLTSTRF